MTGPQVGANFWRARTRSQNEEDFRVVFHRESQYL